MLTGIDRLQLVVPDRVVAAAGWVELLGAQLHDTDSVKALAAQRARYRLGDGWVEFLEPDGAGLVADVLAERGAHLFAAGVAAHDLDAVAARLKQHGVGYAAESGQLHVAASGETAFSPRLVVSPMAALEPVGAIDTLYEVTLLASRFADSVARFADLLTLDPEHFVPIRSTHYGYEGTLTLFRPEQLDRLEIITPNVPSNTMGRFFARYGQGYYMAFAESTQLETVEGRARAAGAGFTPIPPPERRDKRALHTLFLHPPGLGGMMLGLSERHLAWNWSGAPERAQEAS